MLWGHSATPLYFQMVILGHTSACVTGNNVAPDVTIEKEDCVNGTQQVGANPGDREDSVSCSGTIRQVSYLNDSQVPLE